MKLENINNEKFGLKMQDLSNISWWKKRKSLRWEIEGKFGK